MSCIFKHLNWAHVNYHLSDVYSEAIIITFVESTYFHPEGKRVHLHLENVKFLLKKKKKHR